MSISLNNAQGRRPGRRALVASAGVAALSIALAAAGAAQAQSDAAGGNGSVGEVVVTGTRIQATGMRAVTPTTVLNQQALADISPGNVSQAVASMPQFFNNTQPSTSGPIGTALGATTVNLRGLGSNRTLTLLDGRRMVPFNQLGTVDISMLPQALTQRIDVVTGGASAAYGTDAVAGVVNFITNTKFEGVDIRAQAGESTRGDDANGSFSVAVGHQFGSRLHVEGSVDYNKSEEVASYAGRSWFQSNGLVTDPSNPLHLLIRPDVVSTLYTCGGLILQPGSALNRLEFEPDGSTSPYRNSTLGTTTGQGAQSVAPQYGGGSGCDIKTQQNRAGNVAVMPGDERVSGYLYADYELTDNVKLYVQGFYGQTYQWATGGSPIMQGTLQGTVYSGNPYLPANVQQIMNQEGLASFGFSRYGTEADVARGEVLQYDQTRSITAGFEATVPDKAFMGGWKVNGYYQYGVNTNDQIIHDTIRIDRLYQALDAVQDPTTGSIVCNAALKDPAQFGNCVPINLFGAGRASQAALNYVEGPDRDTQSNVTEQDVELSASGGLFKNWAGSVDGAFGFDYRKLTLDQYLLPRGILGLQVPFNNAALGIRGVPSSSQGLNQVYQFSTAYNAAGTYDVKEVFGEVRAPLVEDQPLFRHVDLDMAARLADYSGSGNIWAYKFGLNWDLIDQFRIRATYSRDVRAATLQERFNNQGAGGSIRDPLLNNLAYTPTIFTGGNPNVKPEQSDTITVGGVYRPTWAPGLQASIDWYHIKVNDAIGQLAAQDIVNQCAAGAAQACAQIVRDPASNQIRFIYANYINVAALKDSGVDMELDYNRRGRLLGGGDESVDVRFLGTYLHDRSQTLQGALPDDAAGDIGAGYPHYRAQGSISYANGPYRVFLREQFIGDGVLSRNYILGNVTNTNGTTVDNNHVPATFYTDLHFTYTLPGKGRGKTELYFNIDNVLDQAPQVVPGFSQMGGTTPTNAGLYDVIGRRVVGGVHMVF
ncbi:MAG TPA: TonB-dependent receptor [Caulobacteraceae bacterium]|jgi:outer membrane receptor protein involved in Fe transport